MAALLLASASPITCRGGPSIRYLFSRSLPRVRNSVATSIQGISASFVLENEKSRSTRTKASPRDDETRTENAVEKAAERCNAPCFLHGAAKVLLASFLAWLNLQAGLAYAASPESIGASSLGLRIAAFFQQSGFPDEFIVFALATLPVLELRGAIPVGYWLQLQPIKVYVLSVLGNMLPVPFVLLYLEKLSSFLADRSNTAKKFLEALYSSTRRKAGPIQEFKWLGLMLFVAVPFPGTGAWTGAIAAVVLGMPFWSSFWANFLGVLLAGVIVNFMVSLGLRSAILVGLALFAVSTFMWSILRYLRR